MNLTQRNLATTLVVIAILMGLVVSSQAQSPLSRRGVRPDGINAPLNHDFTKAAAGKEYAPGQLIVRFKDQPANSPRAQAAMSQMGGQMFKQSRGQAGLGVVKLKEGQSVEEALQVYNAHPEVLYAEPDYKVYPTQTFPNDTHFDRLWHLHQTQFTITLNPPNSIDTDIDAPEAWDLSVGTPTPGGTGLVVAVIDTGVHYLHEDLTSSTQIWWNADETSNGLDDDGNGYIDDLYGWDFHGDGFFGGIPDNDPMDEDGHGTHVAGTIGAIGNNARGVTGVCWNVRIMPLRFLGPLGGLTSDAVDAVYYAVNNGAHVLNNSWGGGGYSQALVDAIQYAENNDVLFVAAAGNYGMDNDFFPHYPVSYPNQNIISVMASDEHDLPAGFSNYGLNSVDIAAPGVNIFSTYWTTKTITNQYRYMDGTSMAAPVVSGAVALLLSIEPTMTFQDVKERLYNSVEPGFQGLCTTGGRLNLFHTLLQPSGRNFKAESFDGEAAVYLTWENPTGLAFEEVVIRRDTVEYPQSPTLDGTLIYTGGAESFVDTNVVEGEHYLYTIWARYLGANYSTPAYDDAIAGKSDVDYFTENFSDDYGNDLDRKQLVFTPVSGATNYYKLEVRDGTEFPVSPFGGTRWFMGNDAYQQVNLPAGKPFNFYGEDFTSVFVGSNGYVTFGVGSTVFDLAELPDSGLAKHFYSGGPSMNIARISALLSDFRPNEGGAIYTQILDDRFVATWVDVMEYRTFFDPFGFPYEAASGINSFQIELFFDGVIRITYPSLNSLTGVAGLSAPESFIRPDIYRFPGDTMDLANDSVQALRIFGSDLSEYPYFWEVEDYYTITYRELIYPTNVPLQVNLDGTIVIGPNIPGARGILKIIRKPGMETYPPLKGVYCGGTLVNFISQATIGEMYVKDDLRNATVVGGHIGKLYARNIGKVRMIDYARSSTSEGTEESHTMIRSGDIINIFVNIEGKPYGQRIPVAPTGNLDPMLDVLRASLAGVSLDGLRAPNQRVLIALSPKKHNWRNESGLLRRDVSLSRIGEMENNLIEVGHLFRLTANGGGADYNIDKAAISPDMIISHSRQQGRRGKTTIISRTLNTVVGQQSGYTGRFEPQFERYYGSIDVTTLTAQSDSLVMVANQADLSADLIQNAGAINLLKASFGKLDLGLVQSGTDTSFLNPHIARIIGDYGVSGIFQAGLDGLGDPGFRGRIFLMATRYPFIGVSQPGSAAIMGQAYVSDERIRLRGDTQAIDGGRLQIFIP